MPDPSSKPFTEAAIQGHSPIPVDTRTKRPMVTSWKPYQERIADHDELTEWDRWFAEGRCGIALVCGRVSGRLIAVDIEGEFIRRKSPTDYMISLAAAMREHGCYETWQQAMSGYSELTPSNGLHILVYLEGEGPCEGNQKLVCDANGITLAETRGEGGYCIVDPSMNGHRGWVQIAISSGTPVWLTIEEWEVIKTSFRDLDSTPPPPPALTPSQPSILRLSESWIDDVKASLPDYLSELQRDGWKVKGQDGFGIHLTRPGKDPRKGHSASLSRDGYLWVHSTNAGLPTGVGIDIVSYLHWRNTDRIPNQDERVAFLRERRPPAERGDASGPAAEPEPTPSLNLSDDFWKGRSYLTHVQQAALASGVNPDALWEAVKVFYAAAVHPAIVIPFRGTLDYIGVMVGKAGAGKTMAKRAALDLLGPEFCEHPRVKLGAPAGSGEGMVEFFIDRSEGTQRIRFDGAGFYVDEGKWLLDVNSRAGNTSVQAIKQAWSGELTGSLAATAERNRWLAAGAVRVGVLIAIQPGIAADFLRSDLTEGGFPQRLSWGWSHPDTVPDELPQHPGLLDVPMWTLDHWGTSYDPRAPRLMSYDDELMAVVVQARRDSLLGKDTHGGHDTLAVLKGAALLALMDDRTTVTMSDWDLASADWNTGVAVRDHLLRTQQQGLADQNVAAGRNAAYRKMAEHDVYLERAVLSLANKVRQHEGELTMDDIKSHLRSYWKRHRVHHQDVVALAIDRGLVVRIGGGSFARG